MDSFSVYYLIVPQKGLPNVKQPSLLLAFTEIISLYRLIYETINNIQKFFSRFWLSLRPQLSFSQLEVCAEYKKQDDSNLCREEVEMVLGNLGIFCSPESDELKESMGFHELSRLFDEKEPSLDEVKEAFDVFDENKDGFIDVKELQRILHQLGLKEGIELENCRKMIKTFDQNGDGRIDFNEFVRFMENSFC